MTIKNFVENFEFLYKKLEPHTITMNYFFNSMVKEKERTITGAYGYSLFNTTFLKMLIHQQGFNVVALKLSQSNNHYLQGLTNDSKDFILLSGFQNTENHEIIDFTKKLMENNKSCHILFESTIQYSSQIKNLFNQEPLYIKDTLLEINSIKKEYENNTIPIKTPIINNKIKMN